MPNYKVTFSVLQQFSVVIAAENEHEAQKRLEQTNIPDLPMVIEEHAAHNVLTVSPTDEPPYPGWE